MKIVVTGWVAPFPVAGYLWHALSFALGFRDLGHEVWYLEDSGDYPRGYDPRSNTDDPDCRAGIEFLARELADLGLADRWVFRHVPSGTFHGMDREETLDVLAEADVLLNVSLTTTMRSEYLRVPHRLAIDTDPVFTQVRLAAGDPVFTRIPETHTGLFTFGRPPLPGQRHEWFPTRQPVCSRLWPVAGPPPPEAPFATVTTWQAYPPLSWDGVEYGGKDRTLRRFIDLPARFPRPLSLALGAGMKRDEGRALLAEHGWQLADPVAATLTTSNYRKFIAGTAGELGFAKDGYLRARSGWFSERSCCWLASGRPAVVQDTGWTDWLPSGQGLLAFSTPGEAVAAAEQVLEDPDGHCSEARRIVERHFEASQVCSELLDAI